MSQVLAQAALASPWAPGLLSLEGTAWGLHAAAAGSLDMSSWKFAEAGHVLAFPSPRLGRPPSDLAGPRVGPGATPQLDSLDPQRF